MLKRVIDWSVDNRFLVCVLAVVLAVGGAWSMSKTPLDAIPDLSDVQVIVQADWPGRDPKTVEDQVTYPISSALLNTTDVRDVRGFSFFGTSFVYAIFNEGTDPYWARSRVLEHLSRVGRDLPDDVVPTLGPDASSLGWVYLYTVEDTLGTLDLGELRDLQDYYVRYQLSSVPGVAEVATLGGAQRQYQVTVDPFALQSHGIPIAKLAMALKRSNADVGGRVIEMAETEYMVRGRGSLASLEDLEQIVIGTSRDGAPLRLGQIATVEMGPDIKRGIAEKNGRGEVVAGIVTMRYGGNALQLIRDVKAKIAELQAGLPEGVVLRTAYDRSGLIERSIATLTRQLIEEILIVALVCVIFLWHLRSALVSTVILPLGVLCSFLLMRAFGIGANIMSLGGLAIAIGTMVDASVVMVENLHKHKEQSKGTEDHWEVVRRASVEVGPALFFSLLLITVSFLPVFALEDQAGRLFTPLAYTKTFAMASAAVLTLILMPVLMGFFVRGRVRSEANNPVSRLMIAVYLPVLRWALRWRKTAIGLAVVLLVCTVVPIARMGTEFMPPIREGDALAMPTTLPGISSTEARRTLQVQDGLIAEFPEVDVVLGKIGRADTALDPAPLSMVESHITLHPEDKWPERIVELDWLTTTAEDMLDDFPGPGIEHNVARHVARQAALMSQASLARETRAALTAGTALAELRQGMGERVAQRLAVDLDAARLAEGLTSAAAPEAAAQVAAIWGPRLAGSDVPLRRTTFEELTKKELHEHVQVPGMPNWWLMPIETRIGMLATGMRGSLGLKLYGKDLAELEQLATDLEPILKSVPGTSSVIAERAMGGNYLDIDIDRAECARHGLSVGDVQDVIQTAIGGMRVTTAIEGRSRIPVILRYPRELRDDPVRLGRTLVSTPTGTQVPLRQLADIQIRGGPPMIKSENGLLLTNVPIDLEAGADIGRYVERAKAAVAEAQASGELSVPRGTYLSWSGQYKLMEQVRERLNVIVPLTLALIFVLIYMNMKSLTETAITLVTLPFALVGGVWLVHFLDYNFSVAVTIGFIALAGLAAETAILMHVYLDLAYKSRTRLGGVLRGRELREAIVEGAVLRVRPKMMTVVTTLCALLPILWAVGTGAGPMKRMAAPMIGGLITSTLHTLILIPVYYAMVQEYRARRAARLAPQRAA